MGRQAELVLHDGGRVWQPLFITVLGDNDQCVDGFTRKLRVVGEQCIHCFDTQVRGFLVSVFARQERRTNLAKDEFFILLEFGTLSVVIHTSGRHITRYAFYANHHGFPIMYCD